MRRLFICLVVFVSLSGLAQAQERAVREQNAKTGRIALLIGNWDYTQQTPNHYFEALKKLANPCNDIERIAGDLELSGWDPNTEIIKLCNKSLSEMRLGADKFKEAYLAPEVAFGFIYYAGHGVYMINEMYLFGTDTYINVGSATETILHHPGSNPFHGGERLFNDLLSQIGDAGSGSIFVVIDACRDTPVEKKVRTDSSLAQEYFRAQQLQAKPELVGVKILYSTTDGKPASDGVGGNSPFALAFDHGLKTQRGVSRLVGSVIKEVRESTLNTPLPQVPDTMGELNGPPSPDCLTQCGEQK